MRKRFKINLTICLSIFILQACRISYTEEKFEKNPNIEEVANSFEEYSLSILVNGNEELKISEIKSLENSDTVYVKLKDLNEIQNRQFGSIIKEYASKKLRIYTKKIKKVDQSMYMLSKKDITDISKISNSVNSGFIDFLFSLVGAALLAILLLLGLIFALVYGFFFFIKGGGFG